MTRVSKPFNRDEIIVMLAAIDTAISFVPEKDPNLLHLFSARDKLLDLQDKPRRIRSVEPFEPTI